jgi:hypothetical protein
MKHYKEPWPRYAAMRAKLARRPQHYLEKLVYAHSAWNEWMEFTVGDYFGLAIGPTLERAPYGGTVLALSFYQVQGARARDRMFCHAEIIWTRAGLRLNPILMMHRGWADMAFTLGRPMAPGWARLWNQRYQRLLLRWAWRIRRLGCKRGSRATPYRELQFSNIDAPVLPLMYCAEGFTDILDSSLYVPGC